MEQIKNPLHTTGKYPREKGSVHAELHISVRNLVEFIFRAGDIDKSCRKAGECRGGHDGRKRPYPPGKFKKAWTPPTKAEVPLELNGKPTITLLVVEGRADQNRLWKISAGSAGAATGSLCNRRWSSCGGNPSEEKSASMRSKGVYRNVAAMEQAGLRA